MTTRPTTRPALRVSALWVQGKSLFSVYGAMAQMVVKSVLAYNTWVWTNLILEVIALTVFYNFWLAVYDHTDTLGNLNQAQTLNYIILARIFMPLSTSTNALSYNGVSYFARLVRQGELLTELLRPVDFQTASFFNGFAKLIAELTLRLPLLLFALLIFGLELPYNPLIWVAFLITVFLGYAVIFFFDWIISCLAFYTTETWGINMMRAGVSSFLSGLLSHWQSCRGH